MTSWLENNLQKVITNPATHNIMLSAISKCRTWLLLVLLPILFSNCQSQLPDDVELAYRELPDQIDFNIHIRPLLSDRCYACHGPDKNTRKADLRLDIEKDAFERLQTSGKAFVKGNLKKSIAWQRIISDDPEFQMPPPDSHLELSPTEKALIARWIEQGAKWKKHWAFIPPVKPKVPEREVVDKNTQINEIDHFIQYKLGEVGLKPSPIADKERLIRRVTMDLTGLPPTIQEIEAFLADDSADAYEKLIDRLMTTDAYAERMAMEWMDVARYADSHGLHSDGIRENWPWRDWVIRAFKRNMSYEDFVTWQIAGDLLPNATREQKLATGFHRNHPINSESGIVSEEFRLSYVADRTNTTATAFMGLTIECASCHDHKFDPVSQKEYYQMSAFFNNVPELGMTGNDKNFGPMLLLPDPETEQKINSLNTAIDLLTDKIELRKSSIEEIKTYIEAIDPSTIQVPTPDVYFPLESITDKKDKEGRTQSILDYNTKGTVSGDAELVDGKKGKGVRIDKDNEQLYLAGVKNFDLDEGFSAGVWVKIEDQGSFQTIMGNIGDKNTGWRGWIFYLDSLNRPGVKIVHALPHNYLHVATEKVVPLEEWTNLFFTYDGSAKADGIKIYHNGEVLESTIHQDNLYKNIRPVKSRGYVPDPNKKLRMGIAHNYLFTDTDIGAFTGSFDEVMVYHRHLTTLEVAAIFRKNTTDQQFQLRVADQVKKVHYLTRSDPEFQALYQKRAKLLTQKFDLIDPIHEVMVLDEMSPPRSTHILERGLYTSPGEVVYPETPAVLTPFLEEWPRNRLGLAKWLFSDDHPLTARVAVNRYWQMIFGRAIVDTPHDFGTQGSLPTHPELLDWLAVEFRESGWDVRKLLKLMVSSYTYRQSSVATADHLSKDPENKYLARGSTYRWPAEIIRDNALAASGLLSRTVGGESVKPYQPKGLWKDKNEFSGYLKTYIPDTGDSLYRRSMYTFIRRTSPHPAMIAFDAPDRSRCIVKRENTNTPLQALVLMNDPQFVEAARVLAERIQTEGGNSFEDQAAYAFRLLCSRKPTARELELMKEQYRMALEKYQNDPSAAKGLLAVGESPVDENLDHTQTAALTMVTNLVMNFDETYVKR
tara:strand:- start:191 stop:3517 length:3327 start_codon:yes stop_codon:yes gene_type:complete